MDMMAHVSKKLNYADEGEGEGKKSKKSEAK